MNIDSLIPYNGRTIQTKQLKEIGYSNNDINKLNKEKYIVRIRRGYYTVTLKYSVDIKLMKYYLKNNYLEEFQEYFNNLEVKDYYAYYYYFLYSIISNRYSISYDALLKCCELNIDEHNTFNLYSYALLLKEVIKLSDEKFDNLRSKIFKNISNKDTFLKHLSDKDFNSAFEDLCNIKKENTMDKLEVSVLRNLSIKACDLSNKKDNMSNKYNKNLNVYNNMFNAFYNDVLNNEFDRAEFVFKKILVLYDNLDIEDERIYIIKDLLECFNYIVEHQNISLLDYQTNYNYNGLGIKESFILSIKKNDYINSLKIINVLLNVDRKSEYEIYKVLLNRINNFLSIRLILNNGRLKNPLKDMIKDKKYKDALTVANKNPSMDEHDKTIITSLLESIVNIDNKNFASDE